jgi:hypothetical protein
LPNVAPLVLVKANTSSAEWKLPVMATVALASVVLSISEIVRALSMTTGVEGCYRRR